MTRTDGGTLLELRDGPMRAQVATVGAALASLTVDGHHVILPYPAAGVPEGYRGKTLIPWPNRVTDSQYVLDGTTYQLECNDADNNAALHGLMAWVDWQVIHADQDSATLGAFVAPRFSYPWGLESWVTFALNQHTGLTVSIASKNVSDTPAPYGCAQHPYLTWDENPVDSYELTAPGTQVVLADEHLATKATVTVESTAFDYRSPRLIGSDSIDNAFTGMATPWTLSLHHPESGATVSVTSEAPWYQVYTADSMGRQGVAVEPMTCAPNAFNSGEGLIMLQPGQTHTLTYTISASVPAAH